MPHFTTFVSEIFRNTVICKKQDALCFSNKDKVTSIVAKLNMSQSGYVLTRDPQTLEWIPKRSFYGFTLTLLTHKNLSQIL